MSSRRQIVVVLRAMPLVVCLLVAWEVAAHLGACADRWPHLSEVATAFLIDWVGLLKRSGTTLLSVVESFLLGGIVGIALGVYLGGSRWCVPGLYATLTAMKPVPVTVLIPVFLAVFGLEGFIVPIVALPILTNVSVNVAQAIRTCSVRRRALLRAWGVDGPAYIRHVLLFELLDCLLATACILVPFCLALNIALDYFLRVTDGLGAYVASGYERYRFDQMFAGVAAVAAIGLLSSFALDILSTWSLRWKREM